MGKCLHTDDGLTRNKCKNADKTGVNRPGTNIVVCLLYINNRKSKQSTMATTTKTSATVSGRGNTAASKKNGNRKSSSARRSDDSTGPLKKFFIDGLKDLLWAEEKLIEALQKMEDSATTTELKDAFSDHQTQTQTHVKRLQRVFKMTGEEPSTKRCEAMAGLIKEAEHIIQSTPEGSMTRDAALIIAAQKVEHYEIASYGGLIQIALTLDEDKAAYVLNKTIEEEEQTDEDLTYIAESFINFSAGEEDEASDEEENEEDQKV